MSNLEAPANMEGIAIIGMTGRFPGAKNLEQFWHNLCQGIESISTFSDEELAAAGIAQNLWQDANYVKVKGLVEDIDLFDADFFGFTPKEAEITDPQQRLFLECTWETLEVAGYDPNQYSGRIGIYAGTGWNSYLLLNIATHQKFLDAVVGHQALISNEKDHLTTRVSYKLNLTGPSIDIQTACSTSLVAASLACQSLLNYQCDMALAGGVTLTVPVKSGHLYQDGGILSPDGHCRAFDAKARGTVIGNGIGVVLLKRLEEAIADGDCIHAVIKGSAINNDGAVKIGYTAPSVDGQADVIAEAIGLADIDPETIGYIETHGTGTILGDPIEVKALTKAFSLYTRKQQFCPIGSVKSNIGHLDAAAGVAGLIKAVLAVKHGVIPPSLHWETPNPQIDFANSPFYVNSKLTPWKQKDTPRRAGVSSLGIGGTNAHVILEEAPTLPATDSSRPQHLLVLSAKTASALETATDNLALYLQQHPDLNLADVAYTLQIGRRGFAHRRILTCESGEDAVEALQGRDPQRIFSQSAGTETSAPEIVFMFSGQGSQYVGMGWELYQYEAIFREGVDRCCQLLEPDLGLDLRSLIYPPSDAETAGLKLQQTAIAQPAIFVIEYALAQLWMSWGISPQATIGHSIGEYVAACLAGVFSLEDALRLVALRGKLMQTQPEGAMLAVSLPVAEVKAFLNPDLSLAANNSAALCVVSGTREAIAALETNLKTNSINSRRLHTSHAFHSAMMEPVLAPFIEAVKQVRLNPPQLPIISNVTGTWLTTQEATDPDYWAKHLRQTVQFDAGLSQLQKKLGEPLFLEVGPGNTLSRFAKQHSPQSFVCSSLRHPQDQQSDLAYLLNSLGKLWLAGVTINWSKLYAGERRRRLPLPTYPFERQSYWIEPQALDKNASYVPDKMQKKSLVGDWFYRPVWKRTWPLEPLRLVENVEQKLNWLVFIDNSKMSADVVKHLKSGSNEVSIVVVGEEFAQLSEFTYTLNPQNKDDYDSLISALQERDKMPDRIAHFWSLMPQERVQTPDSFERCQYFGLYSILFLTQSLKKQASNTLLQITVITHNVYDITGEETLCPEKATVLAACQVIPQEYPSIQCRIIDLAMPLEGTFSDRLIDLIFAELTLTSLETTVAYRGQHRWQQSFEPVPSDIGLNNSTSRLREEGVYLIVGALNDVGLMLAEFLAKTVRAKLILLDDTDVPKRDEWAQGKLQSIKEISPDILLLPVDVSNETQMREAIDKGTEQFGEINGIIYAAETTADASFSSIQRTDINQCQWHFKPKVYGLLILEKILQNRAIDFCILHSSVSSLIGGFIAHTAANTFIDAFARKGDRLHSTPWIAVNWEGWQFWEEKQLTVKGKTAELALHPQEGVAAFEHLLSLPNLSQIIISTTDLSTRINQISERKLEQKNVTNLATRRHLQTSYAAPITEIEKTIATIWQELIGIEPIGRHDNFFELGGHSLLAVQTVSRIRELFQVELPLRNLLFDTPTIATLAEAISSTPEQKQDNRLPTIPKRHPSEPLPLSLAQERFWVMQQLESDLHLYNESNLFRLTGELNKIALEQSLNEIIKRHEILRTNFQTPDGKPVQIIADRRPLTIQIINLQDLPETERDDKVKQIVTDSSSFPFNLAEGALLRAIILQVKPNEQLFLLTMHHILCDGWSMNVLFQELATLYQAFKDRKPSPLPELPIQYGDFSLWQRQKLAEPEYATHLNYWKQQLGENLPVLELPADYPRPAIQSFRGARTRIELPEDLTQQLKTLNQQEGVTLFVLLLTAFKILLYRYTGRVDLLVGTPISDRASIETEHLIGCMLNTLVLRTDLSGNPSFRKLLARVRDVTLTAYAHQELPFEQLVKELQPNRDLSHTPLFQVMFVFLEAPLLSLELPGLTAQPLMVDSGISKFDISLFLEDSKQGLIGVIEYNSDLFKPETITRMLGHFQTLLAGIVAHPEREISTLPLLTAAEMQQFAEWNNTRTDYPQACIHELFEAQVERTPDAVAVEFAGQTLTYRELNQRANQLAHSLIERGVGVEVLVGICVERSLEMLVGLLGIIKAGGAYVPLDPTYPQERLTFMLEDAAVPVLLTQQKLVPILPAGQARVLCLDSNWNQIGQQSRENPRVQITGDRPIYTIYTSGSTGKPKGATNSHQALCNRLLWMQDTYKLTAEDRVLQKTPFSFDVSVWEFFWPLLAGARLVIARPGGHQDPAYLVKLIASQQITTLHFVPSMLQIFLEEPELETCKSLQRVICSGEALPLALQQRFFQRLDAQLYNLYGPTEAAIDVTSWVCQRHSNLSNVPIGRAIANTQIYILDSYLQPVPIGIPGELHIGGINLARGYLNNPQLTAEKFIPDPFSDIPNSRLYKTRDLARYLPDGNLEFLGRIDHQIKLRGFRIELGEIETVLEQHPDVKQAVVAVQADASGNKRLVAYVVSAAEAIAPTALRTHLQQKLPEYMVPSAFAIVDALPLTPNGKVDRRQLAAIDISHPESATTFTPPATPIQELLAEIWTQILELEQIGIHDNFFELGGHSLLATRVISQIRKTLQIELPLRRLFEAPTIASLAQFLERATPRESARTLPSIQRESRRGKLPLSFAQQRLWYLHQLEPNSAAYNGPTAVLLNGFLDIAALEKSLNEIVQRHELLRTGFPAIEGQPVQEIFPDLSVFLPVVDLQDLPAAEREAAVSRLMQENAQQPFDLAQAPLMRLALLSLNTREHILLLTLHHIVSDAWSAGVFIRELAAFYEAFSTGKKPSLPELPVQYADFAVWQQQRLQDSVFNEQLNYWKQQLEGAKTILELPADKPRSLSSTALGKKHAFTLSPGLAESVQSLCRREGVTLFMTLMAAFNILLYCYAGQEDILVGFPIANRNYREIEGLIGFFANTLVLRTNLSNNPSFRALLQRVRDASLGAYAHQDLPFEQLVLQLQPERHLNHSPLFQVWFVLQNIPMPALEIKELNLSFLETESGSVRHDLKLEVAKQKTGLDCFFEYKTDLFTSATISRMAELFEIILVAAVEQPDIRLSELVEKMERFKKERELLKHQEFQQARRQKLGRVGRKSISGELK